MFIKNEFRKNAQGLPSLLLWMSFAEEGVVLLEDGALQATWAYDGVDMDSLALPEKRGLCLRVARSLDLGSRWMVEANAIRRPVREYLPACATAHPVTKLIDEERRLQFTETGSFFRTYRYLTLTYLPPKLRETKFTDLLLGRTKPVGQSELEYALQANLDRFRQGCIEFEGGFGGETHCRRLTAQTIREADGGEWLDDEVLRFYRECVFGEDAPFRRPHLPLYLNELFRGALTPGTQPVIAGQHLRVLAIDGFPEGSLPGVFAGLEACEFPMRWHQRMMLMDPEESAALQHKIMKAWRGQQRGLLAQWSSASGGHVNQDAVAMTAEADTAEGVARRGAFLFGAFNNKVILQAPAQAELDDWTRRVQEIVRPAGYSLRMEADNAVEAWRGSLPGHGYSDVRMFPVSTVNLADGLPLSQSFCGFKTNPSPYLQGKPSLLMVAGPGNTPVYYNQHVGQVLLEDGNAEGEILHGCMFGPTRGGKSFLLATIVTNWLARYEGAQVFAFDKKASLRNFTWAAGGRWYALGSDGRQIRLAPLLEIETEQDQAWALSWLEDRCVDNGVNVNAQQRMALSSALKRFSARPRDRRSLTDFVIQMHESPELQRALEYYTCESVASDGLLDGQQDELGLAAGDVRFHCFELDFLLSHMDRKIIRAALPVIFRAIEKRLDTRRPTLIPLDEAWTIFDEPRFVRVLKSWLKELAKKNAGVLLTTQNLTDIMGTELETVIIDQCATKIYLPNTSARFASKALYLSMGLNEQQILRIAEGQSRRDYFWHTANGFQCFQLHAGAVMQAFLGRNGDEDFESIKALREAHPESWQIHWLRACRLDDWADFLARSWEETASTKQPRTAVCA